MRASWRRAAVITLTIVALGVVAQAPIPAAAPRLRYAAIVIRHGVRSPTWTTDRLRQWSAEPWPSFDVAPGELTPRGRVLITLLGSYYRQWFAREGLLEDGCRDAARVYIWADTDQRTVETGRALAESVLPGCAPTVHRFDGGEDPLFDPIAAGVVHPNPATLAADMRGRLAQQRAAIESGLRPRLDALQRVLTGDGRADHTLAEQGLTLGVSESANGADLTGPLSTASTMSENLLLEYANGFSGHDLGWGRLDETALAAVLELHGQYADLTRRTPAIAKARSSTLLARVHASLAQAVTGRTVNGALGTPSDRALIVSGHDTNLSNLSGMLDLTWRLPGYQQDETPPGGALVVTLWNDPGSNMPIVRLAYVAQTLSQMRSTTPLSLSHPPASADVHVPACRAEERDGGCPWPVFNRIVAGAIDPAFVAR